MGSGGLKTKRVQRFWVQDSKKTVWLGSYKAGKLEGQEVGKLNYLRALQPYSLQASQPMSYLPDTRHLKPIFITYLRDATPGRAPLRGRYE
jgi:hypothetical protein